MGFDPHRSGYGANEFPTHAGAFKKFGQIDNFVFVLDGDQRRSKVKERIEAVKSDVAVLFLPGNDAPEVWVWDCLSSDPQGVAEALSVERGLLVTQMNRCNSVFDAVDDTPGAIAKHKIESLAEGLRLAIPDIHRRVAQVEAAKPASDIQPIAEDLASALDRWRAE